MPEQRNNLIIFTGPSGVGKGTVVKQLFQEVDNLEFSISATTREKRPGEIEAKNYFFKSRDEFEKLIADDRLLEWAEFVGNYYGTPKDFVEAKLQEGKDVFLEIEVQGALQIMEKYPEALSIFLSPPSLEDLEKRLRGRATETEEKITKRLAKAELEMQQSDKFKHVIVNEESGVAEAVAEVKRVILNARVSGVQV